MALGTMKYSEVSAPSDVEILYNSEYVGKALTLDSTAFTSGVCKAGTPMAADGKKAATSGESGGTFTRIAPRALSLSAATSTPPRRRHIPVLPWMLPPRPL